MCKVTKLSVLLFCLFGAFYRIFGKYSITRLFFKGNDRLIEIIFARSCL